MLIKFNRKLKTIGKTLEYVDTSIIKDTPSLVQADPDDACKFGGELTRQALRIANIRNDRAYVTVDTKVHMLMPGMYPAIPGWHTDGIPRDLDYSPKGVLPPSYSRQEFADREINSVHYHLLVTGNFCTTEFVVGDMELELPDHSPDVYQVMTQEVDRKLQESMFVKTHHIPGNTFVEWDWWDVHRGVASTRHGWRFLIRITESDFLPPETNLRRVIRTQNQVYLPLNFGW